MLGPNLETYGGNRFTMAALVLTAAVCAAGGYQACQATPRTHGLLLISVISSALAAVGFFHLRSLRVTLHTDGISYHSLFREKEMRWDQVERFDYWAVKRSVNFIPVGTYYRFRLRDQDGQKICMGNRFERPANLGERLVQQSTPHLLRKTMERYNQGESVDFGAIKVSRDAGIRVRRLFGYRKIAWNQVANCAIQKGHFYIWRAGEKRTTGPALSQVRNAFVLLALLQSIVQSKTPTAG